MTSIAWSRDEVGTLREFLNQAEEQVADRTCGGGACGLAVLPGVRTRGVRRSSRRPAGRQDRDGRRHHTVPTGGIEPPHTVWGTLPKLGASFAVSLDTARVAATRIFSRERCA